MGHAFFAAHSIQTRQRKIVSVKFGLSLPFFIKPCIIMIKGAMWMKKRFVGWMLAAAACPFLFLAGCGGTAQAPDAGPSEPAVLEADDGAYCAAISAYYSDTHFTEWTVKLSRIDGQPMEESFTPQGAVVEPDSLGGSFGEVACSPGDSWYEEGSFFINYRIFTRPVHQEISIRYTAWMVRIPICFLPSRPNPRRIKRPVRWNSRMG